ncbi:MAG: hypothetical protein IT438_11445 [Phycisphaerales bacterium]|nr:hypothetical protein [Phycisphaerales bacterium]
MTIAMNFIPQSRREAAAIRRRMIRWGGVAASAALAVAVGCLVSRSLGGDERSRLDEESDRVTERLSRADASLRSLRKQVLEANQRLEASKTIGVHPDWSELLRTLAALRGEDVMLTSIDVQSKDLTEAAPTVADPAPKAAADTKTKNKARARRKESYTLQVRGRALSQMGVLEFVKRIEDLGLMAQVSPPQTRAEPHLGVSGVWFEMECRLSERPQTQVKAQEGRP